MTTSVKINVSGNDLMVGLLGERDRYLRAVEEAFDATVLVRGNEISLDGNQAAEAAQVLEELVLILERGQTLEPHSVERAIDMVLHNERPSEVLTDHIITTYRGKSVSPRTPGQKRYVDAVRTNIVTFGTGPAGTGKSWLAVACAVRSLQSREVQRILLTRPAVEAGERLGYLPGDLMSKIDPYLRPLYDALHDMVGPEETQKLIDRGTVEVAPLAFMRGRTLNDSFIILDEAQNTTWEQMKMFLTRIGFNSRAVITGDKSQVDIAGRSSGLKKLDEVLQGIPDLSFVELSAADVVRHRIVQDIVSAYDAHDARTAGETTGR